MTVTGNTEQGKIRYDERRTYGATFKSSTKFVFPPQGNPDSTERLLELRIAATELDEDSDILEALLLPLTVLLVERENGNVHRDIYEFTHEGDFVHHGYLGPGQPSMRYDGDPSKLFRYGEAIKSMLSSTITLDRTLEINPVVRKLRTHTLWQDPPKSAFYDYSASKN